MDKYEIEKLRRKAMTRNQIRITLLSGFALVAALIASRPVAAQDAKQPYPNMAPIDQYLMDRDAEIALARSAAPDAISHDASVIVLTRHGYETAVQGKNGWVLGRTRMDGHVRPPRILESQSSRRGMHF